jgi:hypothetical protein
VADSEFRDQRHLSLVAHAEKSNKINALQTRLLDLKLAWGLRYIRA